ncbi:Protein Wnt-1 [Melipona quadrifasciata]|uniref:Protein Wnt n=1 Tax=Melipona quadrifasciata TaxID=166423 RepID=A0A0N0BIC8_9HYME|nr:Protein Wnt-1 [Melipona quadrifasciata]
MEKLVPQWRNSGASLQIVAKQRSFTQYRQQGLLTASPEPVPGASSPIALATTESEHATRIIGNGAAAARLKIKLKIAIVSCLETIMSFHVKVYIKIQSLRDKKILTASCEPPEDIHFGEKFSREWSDSGEEPVKEGVLHGPKGLAGQLMRKHDSEAGRRAVRSRMQRVCKCHGLFLLFDDLKELGLKGEETLGSKKVCYTKYSMSGSCSVRVCWRRLPAFRVAGAALATLHEGAALVRLAQRGGRRPARLRPARPDLKRPNKTDLVYLEDSPDYCEKNITLGIPGTRGRICNRTSFGLDGCRLLCCGRGYQTRVRDVTEKCNCRFVWCCHRLQVHIAMNWKKGNQLRKQIYP